MLSLMFQMLILQKFIPEVLSHNDLEIALKSITLPLGLTYSISDKRSFYLNQ